MTTIEITTPDGTSQYTLQADTVTIGRMGSNDIVLPFSHISRRHAELRWANNCWWIADLHSTNGLHVSGQRVQETPLQPGAAIVLSPHVSLRLLPPSPTPQVPAAQPTQPPIARPIEQPAPPPLAAFGPRSPYAEDETPYYPHMRPAPSASRPRLSQPRDPTARDDPPPNRQTDALPPQPPHAPRALTVATEAQLELERQARRHRATTGAPFTTLHICQTCGQLTAPDAVYCQNCHHSIATECVNCRLSLLPIQDSCPRCQTPNPGAVRRGRHTGQ
jgi:FHA domain-containing protein